MHIVRFIPKRDSITASLSAHPGNLTRGDELKGTSVRENQVAIQNQYRLGDSVTTFGGTLNMNLSIIEKPLFLLVFSNDEESYLRHIPQERLALKKAFDSVKTELGIDVEILDYISSKELFEKIELNAERLVLFHFSGHSNSQHLVFDEGSLRGNSLSDTLFQCKNLKLVFLNGCSNESQARKIFSKGTHSLIGTKSLIDDNKAKVFSTEFYNYLVNKEKSISTSFELAKNKIETVHSDKNRSLDTSGFSKSENWFLIEPDTSWKLLDSVHPCNKIPLVKTEKLPNEPFKGLRNYSEEDAEIFSGRCEEIFKTINLLENYAEQVILISGQSGTGKTSLLRAGLIPRLKTKYKNFYYSKGGQKTTSQAAHPINGAIHIYDQFEEVFWFGYESAKINVGEILRSDLKDNNAKIIFCLRTEWCERLRNIIDKDYNTPLLSLLIPPLSSQSIKEIIVHPTTSERLTNKYNLQYEDNELIDTITRDILSDTESNVAPALQCLLYSLWRGAREKSKDYNEIRITNNEYQRTQEKGIYLEDFFEQKISNIVNSNTWGKKAEKNGLILDILKKMSGEYGNSIDIESNWKEKYDHIPYIKDLFKELESEHLITRNNEALTDDKSSYRLSHDSLAPIVNHYYNISNYYSQSFNRTYQLKIRNNVYQDNYLSESELDLYENAKSGMGKMNSDDYKIIEDSYKKNKVNRVIKDLLSFTLLLISTYTILNFITGDLSRKW